MRFANQAYICTLDRKSHFFFLYCWAVSHWHPLFISPIKQLHHKKRTKTICFNITFTKINQMHNKKVRIVVYVSGFVMIKQTKCKVYSYNVCNDVVCNLTNRMRECADIANSVYALFFFITVKRQHQRDAIWKHRLRKTFCGYIANSYQQIWIWFFITVKHFQQHQQNATCKPRLRKTY